jgi:hypothetical protein
MPPKALGRHGPLHQHLIIANLRWSLDYVNHAPGAGAGAPTLAEVGEDATADGTFVVAAAVALLPPAVAGLKFSGTGPYTQMAETLGASRA